ncbi:MAG: hypothetical protein Q4A55_06350 [Aerococcus sp.]|nr:hypothetical protein [Aerococcus sp.]
MNRELLSKKVYYLSVIAFFVFLIYSHSHLPYQLFAGGMVTVSILFLFGKVEEEIETQKLTHMATLLKKAYYLAVIITGIAILMYNHRFFYRLFYGCIISYLIYYLSDKNKAYNEIIEAEEKAKEQDEDQ